MSMGSWDCLMIGSLYGSRVVHMLIRRQSTETQQPLSPSKELGLLKVATIREIAASNRENLMPGMVIEDQKHKPMGTFIRIRMPCMATNKIY